MNKKIPLLNSKVIELQISEDPIIYNDDQTINVMLHYNSFNAYRDCLDDAKIKSKSHGFKYLNTNPYIHSTENCEFIPITYKSFQPTNFDDPSSKSRDYSQQIFDDLSITSLNELQYLAQTFPVTNGSYREHSLIFTVIPYIIFKDNGMSIITFECKKIEIIHPYILLKRLFP